jgi:hypothetical protein
LSASTCPLRRKVETPKAVRAVGREDIAGLYIGGVASIDLSNVHPLEVATWSDDPSHLTIRLDEDTSWRSVGRQAAVLRCGVNAS